MTTLWSGCFEQLTLNVLRQNHWHKVFGKLFSSEFFWTQNSYIPDIKYTLCIYKVGVPESERKWGECSQRSNIRGNHRKLNLKLKSDVTRNSKKRKKKYVLRILTIFINKKSISKFVRELLCNDSDMVLNISTVSLEMFIQDNDVTAGRKKRCF